MVFCSSWVHMALASSSLLGRGPRDYLEALLLDIFDKFVPMKKFKKWYFYHLNISKRYALLNFELKLPISSNFAARNFS